MYKRVLLYIFFTNDKLSLLFGDWLYGFSIYCQRKRRGSRVNGTCFFVSRVIFFYNLHLVCSQRVEAPITCHTHDNTDKHESQLKVITIILHRRETREHTTFTPFNRTRKTNGSCDRHLSLPTSLPPPPMISVAQSLLTRCLYHFLGVWCGGLSFFLHTTAPRDVDL